MARSTERGHHVTCALIGTSHKLAAYNYTSSLRFERRLSELVDANEVCQGIQKVRVEPPTRSAVATWKKKDDEIQLLGGLFLSSRVLEGKYFVNC